MAQEYILELQNISKSFPGVKALDNVAMKIKKGQVHALLGENGAGKSTLVKILSGVYTPDNGSIFFNGQNISLKNPQEAQKLGISTVFQELNLIPTMSIAENIFLGWFPSFGFLKFVRWKEIEKKAAIALKSIELKANPKNLVRSLSVADRQKVEICKALSQTSKLLILDEPTSSLAEEEIVSLFKIINELKAQGISIIYISHKIEEICEIADAVTVLREGRSVDSLPIEEVTEDKLINMIVGFSLEARYPKPKTTPKSVLFKAHNFSKKGEFQNINIEVRSGEIFGIFGLVGAKRTELMNSIYGITEADEGKLWIAGKEIKISSPTDAIRAGIYLLPEDRRELGLVPSMSVAENISLSVLDKISYLRYILRKKENLIAEQYVKEVNIKTPSIHQKVKFLSGGNQQKVIFSKGIVTDPKILILDEPTKGIDVGSKVEIYRLMGHFANKGGAVIIISSEIEEILGISDSIFVMHEGRATGLMKKEKANKEKIIKLALAIKE